MSQRHSSNHRRSTGDTTNGPLVWSIALFSSIRNHNRQRTMARASSTEESLLEKLIRTKYPLTNYLHRQQQFAKAFCSTPNPSVPGDCLSTMFLLTVRFVLAESTKVTKARVMQPKPSFNVPDTLDPFASECRILHSSRSDELDFDSFQMNNIRTNKTKQSYRVAILRF